jgi:hypothetical protein
MVQRRVPAESGAQAPEQHSASVVQTSQRWRHPPAATHRWVPSLVGKHTREQQSPATLQTSPAWRWQGLPLPPTHASSWPQRLTPLGSTRHEVEQQSLPLAQTSPSARQPCRSAQ